MNRNIGLSQLILSAWAGGLWTVCGIVVPGLFWLLPDRSQAGSIAARFFYAETVLGLLFGLMYWALHRRHLTGGTRIWLWLAVAAPWLFFIGLRPLMNAARTAGDMARFGQLHGVASLLFLLACVAVGVLVWRAPAMRPAE